MAKNEPFLTRRENPEQVLNELSNMLLRSEDYKSSNKENAGHQKPLEIVTNERFLVTC